MAYVEEKLGELGLYQIGEKEYYSNTAVLKYGWGDDQELVNYKIREAVKAVIRRCKKEDRILSQVEAVDAAMNGIATELSKHTTLGSSVHKAISNFFQDKAITLTPQGHPYFEGFLSFKERHEMRPILVEELLHDDELQLATQPDWYGELDGVLTVIDWKTGFRLKPDVGFQLACNRKLLERHGYKVEQTLAVHLRPWYAVPQLFTEPWENYELRYKNFMLKKERNQPKTFIRPVSGNEKEPTPEGIDSYPVTVSTSPTALRSSTLGRPLPQGAAVLSPTIETLDRWIDQALAEPERIYPGQVGKPPARTVGLECLPARKRGRPRKDSQPDTRAPAASSPRTVIPPRTLEEGVILVPSAGRPPTTPTVYADR